MAGMDNETLTETETKLSEIWMDILKCQKVGRDADFLTSGGDSLAAMLFILRVREKFNVELSIEDFFLETATLQSIAAIIDGLTVL
jgi:acyl carrier protein